MPLTNNEVKYLLDSLDMSYAVQACIMLCVSTGLRRSEAAALNWADPDGRYLRVNKSCDDDGSIKETKTKASVRTIPLTESTYEKLMQWKSRQVKLLGRIAPNTPIFTSDANGKRFRPSSISRWWNRNRANYGVDCTVHDLRHTFTTMLARENISLKTTMALIGDSTPRVVMGIYQHVSDKEMVEAVSKLEGII